MTQIFKQELKAFGGFRNFKRKRFQVNMYICIYIHIYIKLKSVFSLIEVLRLTVKRSGQISDLA